MSVRAVIGEGVQTMTMTPPAQIPPEIMEIAWAAYSKYAPTPTAALKAALEAVWPHMVYTEDGRRWYSAHTELLKLAGKLDQAAANADKDSPTYEGYRLAMQHAAERARQAAADCAD